MRYEWFIARRYLKGTHRGRVRICTIGVTIGVTVLIVVISVMNGFERDFLGKMLGVYGHMSIFQLSMDSTAKSVVKDYDAWIEKLKEIPEVVAVSPSIEQGAMMVASTERSSEPAAQFVNVRGIEPVYEKDVSDLYDSILMGDPRLLSANESVPFSTETTRIDPFSIQPDLPSVFLGIELACYLFKAPNNWQWNDEDQRLQRFIKSEVMGQKVRMVVPVLSRGPAGEEPMIVEARVAGIFKSGFYDFDLRYALTSLKTARMLKQIPPDAVEFLEVKLNHSNPVHTQLTATKIAQWAAEKYQSNLVAMPWMARNPVLLDAVKIEKVVMSAILTMVVLVAAFGISSTLVMTVLEKTREIGTLMAMGARRLSIMSIFVTNGFLVGFYGTLFGVLLGLGVCKAIEILQIRLPGGGMVYVLESLPVQVRILDVTLIAIFALISSTLAGIYPAWKAAKLHPVEALRYE